MTNKIQIFNFEENQVRTEIINKEPYFCASDVCNILEYKNGRKAVEDNCKKDGVTIGYIIDRLGREQKATFISEPNLLRLIMKSTMPKAESFQDWVVEEVLPTIRKTGKYQIQSSLPTRKELAQMVIEAEEKMEQLQLENQQKQSVIEEYIAIDDNKNFTETAKTLHLRPNKFIEMLRFLGYISTKNIPYQRYLDCGWFIVKKTTKEVGNKTRHFESYLITPKGFDFFSKQVELGIFDLIRIRRI